MLSAQPGIPQGGVSDVLKLIVSRMAGGQAGTFARRMGFSKSGVWHWVTKGGLPTLQAWLTICLHSGLGMDRLFSGDLDDWVPPLRPQQLAIPLPESPRKGIASRRLDWDEIRNQLREMADLPEPISLHEACQRVGVEYKQLYLRANREARMIADRFRRHREMVKANREEKLRERIAEVIDERCAAGYAGMSARDLTTRIDEPLKAVRNSFSIIREVREQRDG